MAPSSKDASTSAPVKTHLICDIKCGKCNKIVRNGIICDTCDKWNHFKCANVEENSPPDENTEWECPKCVGLADITAAENSNTDENGLNAPEVTLLEIIKLLKDDMKQLKIENERLKHASTSLDNKMHMPNVPQIKHRGWETVKKQGPSGYISANNLKQFPPLETSNKFKLLEEVVQSEIDRPSETQTSPRPMSPRERRPNPSKNKTRPNRLSAGKTTPALSNIHHNHSNSVPNSTTTRKINLFADSQGRNIAKNLRRRSIHDAFGVVKPNANFEEATKFCHFDEDPDSYTVFMAGTNDIARQKRKDLVRALRKRIDGLRCSNVIVFSVPHRHDLPVWSCVNAEVQKANEDISTVCKYFSNVHYIDISKLGRRFHTQQGLHLNGLGKMYVTDRIMEIVNLNEKEKANNKMKPIEMGFLD